MNPQFEYVIIDDDPLDLDRFVAAANGTGELVLLRRFNTMAPALAFLRPRRHNKVPFVFCDVELVEENALLVGPELKNYCKLLIYVTAHIQYKKEVLDAMGDECLIKPITSTQIQTRAIDRFYRRYEDEMPLAVNLNKLFMYNSSKKVYDQVKILEVLLIVHEKDYLDIFDTEGHTFTVRDTVVHAMSLLEPVGIFVKINPGCIVNMLYIADFDDGQVYFGKDTCLERKNYPLTQSCKGNFFAYINKYQLGKGGGLH